MDRARVLLGRELLQAGLGGHLDVDAEPVGIPAGPAQQLVAGIRDGLEVDVAAEVMHLAQRLRHPHHLFHRVVGALDDPAAEEQALDGVAAVEVQRQPHDLLDAEARPRHVARRPVDAVQAVVLAMVGQQDLEQRDAAAIGRVAVADAHAFRRADAGAADGIAPVGAAGRAGGVVLGGVGQDGELAVEVHGARGNDKQLYEYTVIESSSSRITGRLRGDSAGERPCKRGARGASSLGCPTPPQRRGVTSAGRPWPSA